MTILLIGVVLVFVCIATLFVSHTNKKKAITTDQFLTARSSTKWWQVTLSTLAVLLGGWALYTPAETAILGGVAGCIMFASGATLGIVVFGFIGGKIRSFLPNGSSGTEFMGARYGRASYYLMTLLGLFLMSVMLTSELTGLSAAINYLWGIPKWIVIVAILAGVVIYTSYGGMKASLFIDSIQTIIIVPTLVVAFLFILSAVGGWGAVVAGIQERAPQLLSLTYVDGWEYGGGFALGLFTATFVDQSYWQRAYAVKNSKDLPKTFISVAIIAFPLLFLCATFGLMAKGIIDVQNQSIALFELLDAVAPLWLQVFVLITSLALIMSTAGGCINGLTGVIAVETKNILVHRANRIDSKKVLKIARIGAICVAALAGIIALNGISILYMYTISNVLVTASAFPLFYGMKNRRLKDWGVILAFVIGVGMACIWIPDPTWSRGNMFYCMVAALFVPAIVSIILGCVGKPVDMSNIQERIIEIQEANEKAGTVEQ